MSNSVLWVLGILPGLCISVMVSWAAELCPELHCVPQHPQKGQWDEPRSISVVLNSSFTNWLCHCCFYFQITACSLQRDRPEPRLLAALPARCRVRGQGRLFALCRSAGGAGRGSAGPGKAPGSSTRDSGPGAGSGGAGAGGSRHRFLY